MKNILTNLWNRLFNRNKKFIVWTHLVTYKEDNVHFTYIIEYYPYRVNKYILDCTPRKSWFTRGNVEMCGKWDEQKEYSEALDKLSEFQSNELIDLITLPKIEGIKA